MKKLLILLIIFCFSVSLVSAFDFTIEGGNNLPNDLYEGETATVKAEIYSPSSNICNIKCTWYHAGESETFVEELINGNSVEFSFPVLAGSNGYYDKELSVICEGLGVFCQTQETETETNIFYNNLLWK